MRIAKKIAAAVLSLSLVIAVSTTCFGATWGNYFGQNAGWFEGANGSLTTDTLTKFEATMEAVGWGGVYGAQIYLDGAKQVNIKKGQTYTISFTAKSSGVNKYIYIKIGPDEALAHSFWAYLPKGKSVKVTETFKAKANLASKADVKTICFGLGGDAGNREGVDDDASVRYAVFDSQFKPKNHLQELANDSDGDFSRPTKITVSDFCVLPQVTISKVKSTAKKTIKVTFKKATTGVMQTVAGYQVKVGTKTYDAKAKTSLTIKKLKSGKKVKVQVRSYNKGKKAYGAWSKAKTIKVK